LITDFARNDRFGSIPAVAAALTSRPLWVRERYGQAGIKRQILSTSSVSEQLPTIAIQAAVEVLCQDSRGPPIALTVIETLCGFDEADRVYLAFSAHRSNLMAPGMISRRWSVLVMSRWCGLGQVTARCLLAQAFAASKASLSASRPSIDCDSGPEARSLLTREAIPSPSCPGQRRGRLTSQFARTRHHPDVCAGFGIPVITDFALYRVQFSIG